MIDRRTFVKNALGVVVDGAAFPFKNLLKSSYFVGKIQPALPPSVCWDISGNGNHGIRIDWDHPLAKGLVGFWSPYELHPDDIKRIYQNGILNN